MSRGPGWFVRVVAALVLAFLAVPILIIFPLALSPSGYLSFPPRGMSVQWMRRILAERPWLDSMLLSLELAAIVTVLATLLALGIALALVRGSFPGKRAVYALVLSPMIVPGIITAIAVYFFFAALDMIGSVAAMALGQAILAIPVAVIILSASLQGFDLRLEQAAMSLGASRVTAFRRVTLPLIAPGLFSAAVFAFLTSFDELLIPLFLSGPTVQTLPVRIWNTVLFQLEPTVAAVSALMITVTVVALAAANLARRRGMASAG